MPRLQHVRSKSLQFLEVDATSSDLEGQDDHLEAIDNNLQQGQQIEPSGGLPLLLGQRRLRPKFGVASVVGVAKAVARTANVSRMPSCSLFAIVGRQWGNSRIFPIPVELRLTGLVDSG